MLQNETEWLKMSLQMSHKEAAETQNRERERERELWYSWVTGG
jgi:hypothetical protein